MQYLLTPLIVDFVLESGNGDVEDTVNPFKDAQSGDEDSDSAVDASSLSPEAMPLQRVGHDIVGGGTERLNDSSPQTNADQHTAYFPAKDTRESQVTKISWPLRDPQEAYLLKYFVDRISPFVSQTYACQIESRF